MYDDFPREPQGSPSPEDDRKLSAPPESVTDDIYTPAEMPEAGSVYPTDGVPEAESPLDPARVPQAETRFSHEAPAEAPAARVAVLDPPAAKAPVRARRRRGEKPEQSPVSKAVAITAVSILAIVAVSAVASLLSLYEFSISGTSRGLEITYTPRDLPESYSWSFGGDEEDEAEGGEPIISYPGELEDDEPMPAAALGDGTTLDILQPPRDEETGERLPLSYQEIYQKCSPSIVTVEVTVTGGVAYGTGIILSENGHIITNAHVVEDARRVRITLENGDTYQAAIVGEDTNTDLAVLKINAENLSPAEFGDSGALEVGEEVVVIGNPLGQTLSMSNGIVSALDREMTYDGNTMSLIQTNAAINEGNSGGPLINLYGQVVGITNMKLMSYYSTVEGMGFAIPTQSAKPVVDELIERGYVSGRPSIGIIFIVYTQEEAAYYGEEPGIHIQGVVSGSDAEKKGILPGDIVVACNGIEVADGDELNDIKSQYGVGDTLVLTVLRDGQRIDFEIELLDSALLD